MKIEYVLEFDPTLRIVAGEHDEFDNLGPVKSNEPGLLTYARDKSFAVAAMGKPNIVGLFVRRPNKLLSSVGQAQIISDDPEGDFFRFHNWLYKRTSFYTKAWFDESEIAESAIVWHGADVDRLGVRVGSSAYVAPGAALLVGTTVGERVKVGPGAVLGVEGARFVRLASGERLRVIHAGGVVVADGAFIGANAVIVRGVWRRPTRIGERAFIGNLVNIGHNCQVGKEAIVLPGAVLCGSVSIGARAVIGPRAVVANGLRIGEGAMVTMGAVVTQNVPAGERVSGNFAVEHKQLLAHVKEMRASR